MTVMKQKVWISLLVSIAVTILLSIINWLYNRSRVAKNERDKVSLELHSLFIFGLLVSKGIDQMVDSIAIHPIVINKYKLDISWI